MSKITEYASNAKKHVSDIAHGNESVLGTLYNIRDKAIDSIYSVTNPKKQEHYIPRMFGTLEQTEKLLRDNCLIETKRPRYSPLVSEELIESIAPELISIKKELEMPFGSIKIKNVEPAEPIYLSRV
jgi:hypothetical protein